MHKARALLSTLMDQGRWREAAAAAAQLTIAHIPSFAHHMHELCAFAYHEHAAGLGFGQDRAWLHKWAREPGVGSIIYSAWLEYMTYAIEEERRQGYWKQQFSDGILAVRGAWLDQTCQNLTNWMDDAQHRKQGIMARLDCVCEEPPKPKKQAYVDLAIS